MNGGIGNERERLNFGQCVGRKAVETIIFYANWGNAHRDKKKLQALLGAVFGCRAKRLAKKPPHASENFAIC